MALTQISCVRGRTAGKGSHPEKKKDSGHQQSSISCVGESMLHSFRVLRRRRELHLRLKDDPYIAGTGIYASIPSQATSMRSVRLMPRRFVRPRNDVALDHTGRFVSNNLANSHRFSSPNSSELASTESDAAADPERIASRRLPLRPLILSTSRTDALATGGHTEIISSGCCLRTV